MVFLDNIVYGFIDLEMKTYTCERFHYSNICKTRKHALMIKPKY